MVDNSLSNDNVNVNCHHINLNGEQEKGLQHLCLDKAYNSELEERINKTRLRLHKPYKKKKGKEVDNEKTITTPNRKKYSPKRWVVERTNSWHNKFRKLFTRYEKKVENYLGLVQLSCCIIIYRKIILG